jgi:hypothetical protein
MRIEGKLASWRKLDTRDENSKGAEQKGSYRQRRSRKSTNEFDRTQLGKSSAISCCRWGDGTVHQKVDEWTLRFKNEIIINKKGFFLNVHHNGKKYPNFILIVLII